MPNYSKTVIYKIVNYNNPDLVYVGSTTNFTKHKIQHKNTCNNDYYKGHNIKLYRMIRENGGWDKFEMVFLCNYPCESKREAEKEEDKYMLELKSNMNDKRAYHTNQEIRLENVEVKKEYDKLYRELNVDKLQHIRRVYRENNKKKIAEIHKKYRRNNWDYIKRKINCECGMKNLCANHMDRHRLSKLHNKC